MTLVDKLEAVTSQLRASVRRLKLDLFDAELRLAACRDADAWVQSIILGFQAATHDRLAAVVTKCLKLVFGDDAYSFAIRFEGKGKVRFCFERGGEAFDPDDQVGGGVLDVAAFALRIAALTALSLSNVLVLDEPFRFVSKEYRPHVAALLDTVSREFGVQIIQVTHAKELVAGEVVTIGG